MDANAVWYVWSNLIFRWIHVVAGIAWIGHLYFFNFVNAQVAKTYDADSKKKVVPELMPRALYWFRWGAAYTWITGILLLGLVVDMGGLLVVKDLGQSVGIASGVGLSVAVLGWFVYDPLWRAMAKKEQAGVVLSLLLLGVVAFTFTRLMSGRAVFIHIGALLGTLMASNVWFRIWPSQRKIIAAIKEGAAPDPAVVALAGFRSKQNTYMSVPLVFMMVSNHFATVLEPEINGWRCAGLVAWLFVVAGMGATKWLYRKSASPAPAKF
jgi:uncharacterized membrane protein